MSTLRASLLALFVTLLWSSSWVLIRFGLTSLDPLPFAGMRYGLAGLLLLAVLVRRPDSRAELQATSPTQRRELVALGVVLYAATQGAQFVSLSLLPAATASMVLTFTPIAVAIVATRRLAEPAGRATWAGLVLALGGAALYLRPTGVTELPLLGLAVATAGMLTNAWAAVLGRRINRSGHLGPLAVTTPSMLLGAGVLLGVGVPLDGLPELDVTAALIVVWLAVVNTAIAFTLWNRSLRWLTATASATINNTMLVQIAVLAWVFLGEALTGPEIVGLVGVAAGTLVVQLAAARRPVSGPASPR